MESAEAPDEPSIAKIADLLANLKAEVSIEKLEHGLRFTFGPKQGQPTPYPLQNLGALWNTNSPLIYGKWEVAHLKACAAELAQLWEPYSNTEIGAKLRELDDDGTLSGLSFLASQINRTASSGTFQVTIGNSLEVITHEAGSHLPSHSIRQSL